ncbi:MAG: hypothetical protein ACRDF0_08260 [Candidatus Limnocylindria bacterium]
MDDEVAQLEDEIRSRLQRDLRSVAVRPYAHYRAGALERMRPRVRPLHVAGGLASAAAIVLLAVVIGTALGDVRREAVTSPSPEPTTSPAVVAPGTVSPTAATSPSPTAATADRYGYVFTLEDQQPCTFGCGIFIRRESDGSVAFQLDGVLPAVSPDGRRLAYWRTTRDVGPTDLRVLEVADPRTERSVFTVEGEMLGSSMVWSNDGQGLLAVIRSRDYTPGPGSHCFAQTTVLMIDLTTSPSTPVPAVAPESSACVYLPVAWDRPGRAAAAVTTGPGGYAGEYVTWNGNASDPYGRVEVPVDRSDATTFARTLLIAGSLSASSDAKVVLGAEASGEVLRLWPILDITRAEQLRQPARVAGPLWRPGRTSPYELIRAVGQRIELFTYPSGATTDLYTSATSPWPVAVRPDGSAVLVGESSVPAGGTPPPGIPSTRLIVVDVTTGQASDVTIATPALGGNHQVLSRGVLLR